jgi:uncharacterized membrane protein YfhO
LYLYIDGLIGAGESLSVFVEDEFLTTYGNAACVKILNLGYHKAGDVLNVTIQGESEDDNFGRPVFVTEDSESLDAAYKELAKKGCDVTVKPAKCELAIAVPEGANGVFLTVPYDTAWKVKVDGKKVTPIAIYDSLTYIPLDGTTSDGTYLVHMKYTPKGFWIGLVLSIMGLVLLLYVEVAERLRARS